MNDEKNINKNITSSSINVNKIDCSRCGNKYARRINPSVCNGCLNKHDERMTDE